MICLLQRVTQGEVSINNEVVGKIGPGLVVLTGFQPGDQSETLHKMSHKLLHYRVFSDNNDKMNLNVQQVSGGVLLVPQFTLAADTKSGLRPSFSTSAPPEIAIKQFDEFVQYTQSLYPFIQTGKFGADMKVSLINDGPVTFWLEI